METTTLIRAKTIALSINWEEQIGRSYHLRINAELNGDRHLMIHLNREKQDKDVRYN